MAMAFADAEDDRSSGGGWVGVGGRFSVGTLADGCVCHLVPGSCGIVQPSARVRNGDGRGRRWVKRLVAAQACMVHQSDINLLSSRHWQRSAG